MKPLLIAPLFLGIIFSSCNDVSDGNQVSD